MFRTSCVYHQEDRLYMEFFYGMFFMRLCKQSSRWKNVLDAWYKKHKVHNIRYLCLWYSFLFKVIHFKSHTLFFLMLHPLLNMCRCLLIWHTAQGCCGGGCCSTLMLGSNFCPLKLTFKQWEHPEITWDKSQGPKDGCSTVLPQMSAITNITSCTVCDTELSWCKNHHLVKRWVFFF